ncbi:MAG: type II toxin-antitoxin system RelE/ParE family toxin [Desulfosoma sp.]
MFQVDFTAAAETDPARRDKPIAQRALKKLRWLAENFDLITPETLTGPWTDVLKLRVGDHRVLYTRDRDKRRIVS